MLKPCWHHPERRKICNICRAEKPLNEFYSYGYTTNQGKRSTRYESRCIACSSARRKEQRAKDPIPTRLANKRWQVANRDYVLAKGKERRQNPEHKRMKAYYQRLRKARMRSGANDDEAIKAIYSEAMRIEALIQNCPVFDIPELGKKMHVDHRIPLARGGKHEASNLQIMAAGLNLRKGMS